MRDGGVEGVVVRLGGRAFNAIEAMEDCRIVAGAAAPDQFVAKAAATGGVDGLAFLRGVPGAIGGALRMNAGAHGREIKDALVEAHGLDRSGATRVFASADMGYSYRHSAAPDDVIFTRATLQGRPGDPDGDSRRDGANHPRARSLAADPREDRRLDVQEPAGDEGLGADRPGRLPRARRRRRSGLDDALQFPDQPRRTRARPTSKSLGEEVRRRVREASGVTLEWEIKRIGRPVSSPRQAGRRWPKAG